MAPMLVLAALAAAVLAGGCGEKKRERPQPQVAARVDGSEITLPQIARVLEQQPRLRPEQVDAASRQVLERLIDQRLLAAQAERMDLGRDARVRENIDAATREVLARAYADRLDDKLAPPDAAEVDAYYRAHPERFAQRRIYTLQELAIEAGADQFASLRERFQSSPSVAAFVDHLKAAGLRFSVSQVVRAAEQLAPSALTLLERLHEGQAALLPAPGGALVMVLIDSQADPLSPEQARRLIEPMLVAERRRGRLEAELQSLRRAARIEYRGPFAHAASAPTADAAGSAAERALPVLTLPSAEEASVRRDPP
ncbi:MAG TPA: EpsD family peptidyl-prolyl cis-trans isomerase [Rubrivivax sp.]|nr:EpsD family peptidyl-prolyl cis-trans isomerase [Rubrivivax sp.]